MTSLRFLVAGFLALVLVTPLARADIQAPPASDQGPTRKLGRGISNVFWATNELVETVRLVDEAEGNDALGYGTVKGLGRMFARMGVGVFEILTFPWPTNKGKYTPHLRPAIPWIYSGYEEFPPELGWESRYPYARALSVP
ncbi:MAG: exosortase system-associated protein, TIGR04073 family [Verrucomicrobia bacterium]|nr:exosortase system-associated protein, TIGR04073 family [Verrucomicrobiota bacterium]